MATHDYVIANGTGAAVRADLNNALAAIVSNNSGTSEPATTYAYQWWADTTNNVLKIRNSANNAWITLRELDGTMLIEDGSASTPGLAFADDTNTGIFSDAADRIGFATGGVERFRIETGEVIVNEPSNDVNFRVESNGNTHMLFVDGGSDRVGIGTSSPGRQLQINGDSDTQIRVVASSGGTAGIQFGDADDSVMGGVSFDASDDSLQLLGFNNSEAMRIDSSGRLLVGTSSSYGVASSAEAKIQAGSTAATIHLSLTDWSNVNQGGTLALGASRGGSVGSYTAVQGGDNLGSIRFAGADGTDLQTQGAAITAQVDLTPGSNDMPGRLVFSTTADGASSPTERVRIDSSGNVGIGTTSPTDTGGYGRALDIQSNTGAAIYLRTNDDTSQIAQGASDLTIRTRQAHPIIFNTNNSERMRIDSSGRLLAGTSSDLSGGDADAKLQVNGDGGAQILLSRQDFGALTAGTLIGEVVFRSQASGVKETSALIKCEADATQGSGDKPGRLMFMVTADGASTPSEAFNIRQNGEIESDPTYANTTAGAANVHITSGGFFARSTSSGKYKTNIETLEDSYADAILDIRPVWYRSTCEKDNSEHGWWGFIAEEVAAVDPRLVHWKTVEVSHDEDGRAVKTPCDPEPEGVAYERFVPHLLNLIKRQQSAIQTLEAKVAALEAG